MIYKIGEWAALLVIVAGCAALALLMTPFVAAAWLYARCSPSARRSSSRGMYP